MATTDTAISIASLACLQIGALPITSFADESIEAKVAGAYYPVTYRAVLTSWDWSFAKRTVALNRETATPPGPWQYRFGLPADFVKARDVPEGGPYEIAGGKLLSNDAAVTLEYTYTPNEVDLPGYFTHAFMYQLAADICVPITENDSKAAQLATKAEHYLGRAKALDAQQHPGRPQPVTNFVDARRGGGSV